MKNLKQASAVLAWAKSTDLTEVSFKKGGEGFEFRLEGAPLVSNFPPGRFTPVASPAVGIFRAGARGAAKCEEGSTVAEGKALGVIETGGKDVEVKAPSSGKVAKILAKDGDAVEYGQGLLLIAAA